jgi:hypothetical protein
MRRAVRFSRVTVILRTGLLLVVWAAGFAGVQAAGALSSGYATIPPDVRVALLHEVAFVVLKWSLGSALALFLVVRLFTWSIRLIRALRRRRLARISRRSPRIVLSQRPPRASKASTR